MNGLDLTLGAVILLFTAIGVWRGVVREILSFATWIIAGTLGWMFRNEFADVFAARINDAFVREILAFIVLFLGLFLALNVAGFFLRKAMTAMGLKTTERALGAVLGAARGVAVAVVLVTLAGLTSYPQQTSWRESQLVSPIQLLALRLLAVLPPDVARHFSYS